MNRITNLNWPHDMACEIIIRAAEDWHMLEDGKQYVYTTPYREKVYRRDMVDFFYSQWFDALCEVSGCCASEDVRAALNVHDHAYYAYMR